MHLPKIVYFCIIIIIYGIFKAFLGYFIVATLGSDLEIWKKLKHGDKRAITNIYESYYSALFKYGYCISGNKTITKNAIQEVFSELWRNREQLSAIKDIRSYLLSYLKRKILNELSFEPTTYADQDQDRFQKSFEDLLIDKDRKQTQQELLDKAMNKFSERHKEIFCLKFHGHLSYQDISKVTSLKYQVVKDHVYDSLKLLRNHLIHIFD